MNDLSEETFGFVDRAEEILSIVVGPEAARQAMTAIIREFGGTETYIAKRLRSEIEERNLAIKQAFNGTNYTELADRHGISISHIRRIVHEVY